MNQEEKPKTVFIQQKYRVSTNYDHYVSFKNPDGTLGFKLIRNTTSKYVN